MSLVALYALSILLALLPAAWLTLRFWRRLRGLQVQDKAAAVEIDRLRQELELSRQRCRNLLDNAGDAIFLVDPSDGSLLEVNRRAEELLGYRAAEIRSLSLSVLFPGRHRRRYLRFVRKVLRQGYAEEDHLVLRTRDGRRFIGVIHARLGNLGTQRLVHGVLRDVTEVKRAEQELIRRNRDLLLMNRIIHRAAAGRNLQEMLDAVLEEVTAGFEADGGGVFLVRHEGNSLHLQAHQGIDQEEILAALRRITPGKGLAGRVATSGQPVSSADLQRDGRLCSAVVCHAGWRGFQAIPLAANQKTVGVLFLFTRSPHLFTREEVRLLLAIGKQVGTAVEGGELFDALQWQYRLTRASNRELERSRRQLKNHLERLEEANRTLARVDEMKNRFLALASHELRTPLTYILSGSEYLLNALGSRMSTEEVRFLEAIHLGGRRLNEIVDDLLEVARLESRSIYLAREEVRLPTLMAEVSRHFQPVLQERGLTLSIDRTAHIPGLFGDPQHLLRTFQRLVENAVKFTPRGGLIEICTAFQSPSEILFREDVLSPFLPAFFRMPPEDPFVQISVRDTGMGIPPEEHLRIFDKFHELGDIASHFTSQTRFGGKGVGLGLTLVKGMVEAHGGMVWVESPGAGRTEGGSAFHVLLPLAASSEEGES